MSKRATVLVIFLLTAFAAGAQSTKGENGGEVMAPIGLLQRHREDPLADDLAVEDDAVAIADGQIEGSLDPERLH